MDGAEKAVTQGAPSAAKSARALSETTRAWLREKEPIEATVCDEGGVILGEVQGGALQNKE